MVKDRLPELIAVQTEDDESELDVVCQTTSDGDLDLVFGEVEELVGLIQSILNDIAEVAKTHNKSLYSKDDAEAMRQIELDDLGISIQTSSNQVLQRLKGMAASIREAEAVGQYPTEGRIRIRETQNWRLSTKLQDVMTEYFFNLCYHREKCKGRILKLLEILDKWETDDWLEGMLEAGSSASDLIGVVVSQECTQAAEIQFSADIATWHAAVLKLVTRMDAVAIILLDLVLFVESQGGMRDSIVYHAGDYFDPSRLHGGGCGHPGYGNHWRWRWVTLMMLLCLLLTGGIGVTIYLSLIRFLVRHTS